MGKFDLDIILKNIFNFQKVNGDEKKETPMEVDETGE